MAVRSVKRPRSNVTMSSAGGSIHALNEIPVESLNVFRSTVDALKPGAAELLIIERDAIFRFVAFEIKQGLSQRQGYTPQGALEQ